MDIKAHCGLRNTVFVPVDVRFDRLSKLNFFSRQTMHNNDELNVYTSYSTVQYSQIIVNFKFLIHRVC